MEKQTMYVFTATSTECLGVEDARVFSTEEKAKTFMQNWIEATENSDEKGTMFNDCYYQLIDKTGVTWTAEITETNLDE